ncbi:MAG: hypothetical protein ACO1SX_03105 [Actinomycetota bacterium]
MDKFVRQTLVASLVEAMRQAGSWCGRTHIQKSLFALQTLFEPEPELRYQYVLYRHGMYSFELDRDIAELEFYGGLAREEQRPYGPRYAAPGLQAFKQRVGVSLTDWTSALEFIAREVGTGNVRELEALTTVMYVSTDLSERSANPTTQLKLRRVHELKPHLSMDEIAEAQSTYDRLRVNVAKVDSLESKPS